MAIFFDEKHKIFSLDTLDSTYQFKIDDHGFLLHLYYGAKIKGRADYLLQYLDRGFSGNPSCAADDRKYSMDVLPLEMPVWGNGDFRSSSLVIEKADGSRGAEFKYVAHLIKKGKYSLPGLPAVYAEDDQAETLEVVLKDKVLELELKLLYGVLPKTDIITRAVQICSHSQETVYIDKLHSASVDFLYGNYDLITFNGRHLMERMICRTPVTAVAQKIGSRRGTSSHQNNPLLILACPDTTDITGNCMAMEFVYSGGFLAEAERDQFGTTRVQMGLPEEGFHYPVYPGDVFTAPEVIMSYSTKGLDHLSHNLHECINNNICRGYYKNKRRPVIVNSWEADYFNISRESLLRLAKEAKQLGIEMLVIDDGWFGRRNDDRSSLGDWYADEKKLGGSLKDLVNEIVSMGLKCGIWMEPEMISENSKLFKKHPDWAFILPGRSPVRGRDQLVLDFSRKEVRDYIYDRICDVLDSGDITYLKWDFNRSICDVYSYGAEHQGKVLYDYVIGLYSLLEKVKNNYPEVLIEGCSGGGGRYDAGMMYYAPQIWCSDNTDAIDRLTIQYGSSFGYPASVLSAHVSASPNEQTGRVTPFITRGITAMYGAFGYEMNLNDLTENEKEIAKRQISFYKNTEHLIREGRYFRLSDPQKDSFCGWSFVSKDKKEALVSVVVTELHGNAPLTYLKCKGLKQGGLYKEKNSAILYAADLLMEAGIPLPRENGEYRAYIYHLYLQEERNA